MGCKYYGSRYVSPALRQLVLIRDNYTCQYCGLKANPDHYHPDKYRGVDWIQYDVKGIVLEIDHIIAHCKGGPTVANNLIVSCRRCNQAKKHHSIEND